MGIFSSILGLAGGAATAIFGGIQASKAAKKAKANVELQQRQNEDWYNRRYNEDSTQRADALRLLTMTQEAIKNRNKAAAGTAAMVGASEERVAAEKAANAQMMADAVAQINAKGEDRKDKIESAYIEKEADLNNQLNQIENNRAAAISQATQGAAGAATEMGQLLGEQADGWLSRKKGA